MIDRLASMIDAMRRLFVAACVLALGGCTLIYNPNKIEPRDAAEDQTVDQSFDGDPTMVMLTDAQPPVLYEGQGVGGSRRAMLVLTGHHFAPGATVELIPASGSPMISVDNFAMEIAGNLDYLMVPVTLPVDPSLSEGTIALTVKLTQVGLERMLPGKVTLQNLDELTDDTMNIGGTTLPKLLYSQVNRMNPISFGATSMPVIIRSVSSIVIGDVTANAVGKTPGPNGGTGGDQGQVGGGAGGGAGAGLSGPGGGGGFAAPGLPEPGNGGPINGDPMISSYANNYGSGGGGGDLGASNGGGGGGTVELTAAGTLMSGKISAKGGQGANGTTAGAGGGSGGAVVIRAGVSATVTGGIDASSGGGGTGVAAGGAGSLGRIRIDTLDFQGSPIVGDKWNGAAFASGAPLFTREQELGIQFLSVAAQNPKPQFKIWVLDKGGGETWSTQDPIEFGTDSKTVTTRLTAGYNRVCIISSLGNPSTVESKNCIDLAWLPY